MSILIADSGSTTTDWGIISDTGTAYQIKTAGINPVHQDDTSIADTLQELSRLLGDVKPRQIYFYGAGCVGEVTQQRLQRMLSDTFPTASVISVESDLLGAARSLCQREKGLAGILGTGANSCHYDGDKIIANVPPLGYILGDEGSGASLGKAFLRLLMRNRLKKEITDEFYTLFNTDYQILIQRIYREPAANRFLASLSPFIARHIDNSDIQAAVIDTFDSYFNNHIKHYDYHRLPLHLTGSVAYYYAEVIRYSGEKAGVIIDKIARTPIDGLIKYHSQNQ